MRLFQRAGFESFRQRFIFTLLTIESLEPPTIRRSCIALRPNDRCSASDLAVLDTFSYCSPRPTRKKTIRPFIFLALPRELRDRVYDLFVATPRPTARLEIAMEELWVLENGDLGGTALPSRCITLPIHSCDCYTEWILYESLRNSASSGHAPKSMKRLTTICARSTPSASSWGTTSLLMILSGITMLSAGTFHFTT